MQRFLVYYDFIDYQHNSGVGRVLLELPHSNPISHDEIIRAEEEVKLRSELQLVCTTRLVTIPPPTSTP
jgi:hypothetical protein